MDKTNKTNNNKKRLLEALIRHCGNVSRATEETGLSRTQHYVWLEEDEAYSKAVAQIEEANLDFAENALRKQIEDGNPACIMFYLKTKGKKRGYIERQELTGKDGGNLQPVNIYFEGKPIEKI